MICPHCRHETIEPTCSACGWDRPKALGWAAEDAEAKGQWERAVTCWEELRSLGALDSDKRPLRGSLLARWALRTGQDGDFRRADQALEEVFRERLDWEEGRQLQMLLYEREGRLAELEEKYRSAGAARWAEVLRLVHRFKGESAWAQAPAASPWVSRVLPSLIFLAGGTCLAIGWKKVLLAFSFKSVGALPLGPVALMFLGLLGVIHSTIVLRKAWKGTKSPPAKDSPLEP